MQLDDLEKCDCRRETVKTFRNLYIVYCSYDTVSELFTIIIMPGIGRGQRIFPCPHGWGRCGLKFSSISVLNHHLEYAHPSTPRPGTTKGPRPIAVGTVHWADHRGGYAPTTYYDETNRAHRIASYHMECVTDLFDTWAKWGDATVSVMVGAASGLYPDLPAAYLHGMAVACKRREWIKWDAATSMEHAVPDTQDPANVTPTGQQPVEEIPGRDTQEIEATTQGEHDGQTQDPTTVAPPPLEILIDPSPRPVFDPLLASASYPEDGLNTPPDRILDSPMENYHPEEFMGMYDIIDPPIDFL